MVEARTRLAAVWAVLVASCGITACHGGDGAESGAAHSSHTAAPSTTSAPATPARAVDRAAAEVLDTAADAGRNTGVEAVVRVGHETKLVVHGMADVAAKRAVTSNDRFPIASITKSMVATAVLQYVAKGRLALTDSADSWLPGLLPSKEITIRQLLSHRSGLHEPADRRLHPKNPVPDQTIYELTNRFTDAALIRASTRHPLDFPPGTDGAYSNIGYTVLGLLLEELSHKPLGTALKEAVFDRAGMTSTTMGGRPTVLGYDQGKVVSDALFLYGRGAGGVVSTAEDVDRFYRHLLAGDLLPPKLVHDMARPNGTIPFGIGGYGLGLWIWPDRCGDGIGHSGAWYGFSSKAFTIPAKHRSVVVLVNESDTLDHVSAAIADNALCF
jgi:D-alanyl-D-alanine carboxypeptidase